MSAAGDCPRPPSTPPDRAGLQSRLEAPAGANCGGGGGPRGPSPRCRRSSGRQPAATVHGPEPRRGVEPTRRSLCSVSNRTRPQGRCHWVPRAPPGTCGLPATNADLRRCQMPRARGPPGWGGAACRGSRGSLVGGGRVAAIWAPPGTPSCSACRVCALTLCTASQLYPRIKPRQRTLA